jgi:Ca2+-binding RTX toxin-like protein
MSILKANDQLGYGLDMSNFNHGPFPIDTESLTELIFDGWWDGDSRLAQVAVYGTAPVGLMAFVYRELVSGDIFLEDIYWATATNDLLISWVSSNTVVDVESFATRSTLATWTAFFENDRIVGNKYSDKLFGYLGNDALNGKRGKDIVYGEDGNDTLKGADDNDRLFGGSGDDLLKGGSGKDHLNGGMHADVLFGNGGGDRFEFSSKKDSKIGEQDIIADFKKGVDTIDLSAIDANTRSKENQDFDFIGSSGFTKAAGELSFRDGNLRGDMNGDGHADIAIVVEGVSKLGDVDLVL